MHISNMRPAAWIGLPLLASLALPLHARQGPPPETVQIIEARLDALREVTSSAENGAGFSGARRRQLEGRLDRAEAALASGDWLGSLRPYAAVADALAQVLVVFETAPIETLEGLAVESRALRSELEELGSPLARRAQRPAALQSLLENAHSSAHAYVVSAGEQGREAGLDAGIYYLKIARGKAGLARMLAELDAPAPEHPLGHVPGLSRYLDQLEAELLDFYQPPLTQERHATFIGLSASLKHAREMRDQNHQLGALEQGLDVARGLAQFDEVPGAVGSSAGDRGPLRQELASWREELAGRSTDVSLPTLWLTRAQAQLADEDSDLDGVPALFQRVLVDYFACFEGDGSEVVAAVAADPTVTVTLVRWPFT